MPTDNPSKGKAKEFLAIVEDLTTDYLVRLFAQIGQSITKKEAETVLMQIGVSVGLKNGQLASNPFLK